MAECAGEGGGGGGGMKKCAGVGELRMCCVVLDVRGGGGGGGMAKPGGWPGFCTGGTRGLIVGG